MTDERADSSARDPETPAASDAGSDAGSDAADRCALFDAWAEGYDDTVRDRRDFPFLGYDDVLDAVVHRATPAPAESVLDLGIGTGNLAECFLNGRREVWGLDFSRAMLERVRERLPAITLVRGDLSDGGRRLDLDRHFDRIVAAYVLHEFPLPDAVRLLRRLVDDHLAPGGRVVFGDIAFPTAAHRAGAAAEWADRWDRSEHYWAADEALPALAAAGLAATYAQISACAGVFTVHPPESPAS
jgi:putative AdoMet-dependent methyltransferase